MKKKFSKIMALVIGITMMLVCIVGINTTEAKQTTIKTNEILKVHYIDVGQADSILIQQGSQNMLIDAGNNADDKLVVDYLKKQNVSKIDVLIGTHLDEDHIGGLDTVIKTFDIGKIYMPKVTKTTDTFKDVVMAIKDKKMKVSVPKVGEKFNIGSAECTILAPNGTTYDNSNNYSIVTKLKYKDNSFMFMGDAENISENEILKNKLDISANVIKIGHHGSNTSTSSTFLTKVNPKYAVISCGKNNTYGHPQQETMKLLQSKKIPVYRTDELGTIVATSNGKIITFDKKVGSYNIGFVIKKPTNVTPVTPVKKPVVTPPTDNKNITVYVTKSGKKYHLGSCSSLKKSKIAIKLEDAKKEGYTPCSKCNPPQ